MLRWGGLKGGTSFARSSQGRSLQSDVPKNWPVSGAHPLLLAYFLENTFYAYTTYREMARRKPIGWPNR